MNTYLVERNMPVNDITTDLADGIVLINLMECISTHKFKSYNKRPRIINQKLENLNFVLNFLKQEGLRLVGIGAEDIVDGNLKLILGLIWTIILRYQIEKGRKESAKNALLEWVRSKIPEYDVKNFTTSWADGLAVCALVNALVPDTVDMKERSPEDAFNNAATGIDAAETVMNIPKVYAPEDMVAAEDDLSCMTYISYFRDYDEEMKKRLGKEEEERLRRLAEITPVADKCSATGLGLKTAEVNIPADFTVTTRNAKGEQIKCGGANVTAQIVAPDESVVSEVTTTDNEDGTYRVEYIPRVEGKHHVTVLINDAPMTKKPIPVFVLPPQPDPSKCTASGPGVEGAPAGAAAPFVVQACNRIGDPIHVGGHKFTAKVVDPDGAGVDCELVDNGDGTYAGSYEPCVPGVHTVEIACAREPIQGSPFSVPITADPDRAFAPQSYAFGPGVEGGCNTFDPCPFTIQAVDPEGNKLAHGGDVFTVDVCDPDGNEVDAPEVKDNGDGTYSVEYHVKQAGPHVVSVLLHQPKTPLFCEHIKGSPYGVTIDTGFDPAKSECFGPGLEDEVDDVVPTNFTVQTRNSRGENMETGGLPIEVHITDPDDEPVDAEVKDNGDGTYSVDYAPSKPGPHKVEVSCKGVPVGRSPYDVEVIEGADAENTDIGTFTFQVQARTRKGEPITHGGDRMEVEVSKDEWTGEATVTDNGDGTYRASYTVPGTGTYKVNVMLNGRKIKGCPYKQVIP